MIGDKTIYQKIGGILLGAAPADSKKIIMNVFDLSENGDGCSFTFDYVNKSNDQNWFLPEDSSIYENLRELLTFLRQSYIDDGQPYWTGCLFTLNADTGKFEMDLTYPEKNK